MEVGGGQAKEVTAKKQNNNNINWTDFSLRLLAFANTLAAAVVLGVDKQTKVVAMQIIPSLPPVNIPVTAQWKYMSAFVYFVVVNAIACSYAAVSLVLTLVDNRGHKMKSLVLNILDLVMVALLFSSGGAAFAVGLLGYKGNSHVRWNKVCNVFGKFCAHVEGAVMVSLIAGVLFLLLVLLATMKLHNNKHHH